MRFQLVIWIIFLAAAVNAQNSGVKIALLKYNGGGDWYSDPTALPNLIEYCNRTINTNIQTEPSTIEVGSPEIFNFPFVSLTGHGNIIFSESDAMNLRHYLEGGGFLYADDNYGMDEYFRREMKKVFPKKSWLNYLLRTRFFTRSLISQTGFRKSMNTTENLRRPLEFLLKTASFVCIPTNVIWAMVGKTKPYTTIRPNSVRKHFKWAPISSRLCLISNRRNA